MTTALGAEAIGVEARGSTRTMINLEIVKAANLPLPPVHRQREIVERFRLLMSRTSRLVDLLSSQLDLLTEHRQVLITAAVTGQLEIPGAAA
jgi:type I restriction enzyme S subunit